MTISQKRWLVVGFLISCYQLALYDILLSEQDDLPPSSLDLPSMEHRRGKEKVRIFYNLYVNGPEDASRVLDMYLEQTRAIDPDIHDAKVSVSSIGYDMTNFTGDPNAVTYYKEGGEDVTLHALWEHCRANPRGKVVYLHSKGSFHPSTDNDKLRRFLTEGALSNECAALPGDCDVCSSRMSSHPHPHTSGNMWLARCGYISKLLDPYVLKEGKLSATYTKDDGCKGFGRYFFEGWVYTHPSARPCDVYPGAEYTWAYENVPDTNFTKDLRRAPRFGFGTFVALLKKSYYYCREDRTSQSVPTYLLSRKWSYNDLYNISKLDESWYLRRMLNMSSGGNDAAA